MHEEGFFSLFHYLIQYLKQQMGVYLVLPFLNIHG